ncbi:hypothetical protein ACWD5Z_26565 [Micromonospora chokoriensis]
MRTKSVAEIFAGASGSGYVLESGLILTAFHLVDSGGPIFVRTLGSADWCEADIVWKSAEAHDAVLLESRTRMPSDSLSSHLKWGSITSAEQVPCRVTGFAATQLRANGARDTETFCGQTVPHVGVKEGALVIQSSSPPRDMNGKSSPWAGMSGGAVFSSPDSILLGIVTAALITYPNSRLRVTPIHLLLGDDAFRQLVNNPKAYRVGSAGAVLRPASMVLPNRYPEAWLLDSRYAVVDFVDGGDELPRLVAWAKSPERFSIGVLTGNGGMGKSRTASQLSCILNGEGWDAGYLNVENDGSWREVASDHPLLIAVDYASRYTQSVAKLIARLAESESNDRVRLLLLERRKGAWWDSLNRQTRRYAEHLTEIQESLNSSDLTPAVTSQHVAAAIAAFSKAMGVQAVGPDKVPVSGLTTPLLIHISALLTLRADDGGEAMRLGVSRQSLLQALLDREIVRWEAALPEHRLDHLHSTQAHQLVAIASLLTPTKEALAELLGRLPTLCAPGDVPKVVEWLADMFGADGNTLLPLGPDLIIEQLLETCTNLDSLASNLFIKEVTEPWQRARVLHLLALSGQIGMKSKAVLTTVLADHLQELVEVTVRENDSDAASVLLASLTSCEEGSLSLARAAAKAIPAVPKDEEQFAEILARLFVLAISRSRRRAGIGVRDVPRVVLEVSKHEDFSELGEMLGSYAQTLGMLSRWGSALAAALEATGIFEALSEVTGSYSYRRQYAVNLSHAGKYFRNLDMHEYSIKAGTRATEIWRGIASECPGEREDLAISLTNLSDANCTAGNAAEAVDLSDEAIKLLRAELKAGRETTKRHLIRALSEAAHHNLEAGKAKRADQLIEEAAHFQGLVLGAESDEHDLDQVGFLNGIKANVLLKKGDASGARVYAEISAQAYSVYAGRFQPNFYYFRGSLELLLKVLDSLGEAKEADEMRSLAAALLVAPSPEDYAAHKAKFESFMNVMDDRPSGLQFPWL